MHASSRLLLAVCLLVAPGCAESDAPPDAPASDRVWLQLGGEPFELELALDPESRHRGLSGRAEIDPDGGMLFVFPEPRELSFVMRDCFVPIDIAFLDGNRRIVAIHEMRLELPRRQGESHQAYQARLPGYPSGAPAQFAVETAGGRLAELGVRVGQHLQLDGPGLIQRAR